jgi:hypothetical protein
MNAQQLGEDSSSAEAWDGRSKPLAKSLWALLDLVTRRGNASWWLKSTSDASDQPLPDEE